MEEQEIVEKLKLDIEERKRSYQKELAKIKKEDNLLNYIKGMLEITKDDVSNFPYYDEESPEDTSEEDFNTMLKYTLKEDKIIASFKSEIKNLYYLEKIGYQHAQQYQETIKHLEEYRQKIQDAWQDLITNETLKKATIKKEEILKKLDTVKDHLLETDEEIENIDSFYEGLQYAHLSESEKTSILLSVFLKNIKKEEKKLEEFNHKKILPTERKVGKIKKENIDRLIIAVKNLEDALKIKVIFPKDVTKKMTRVEKNRFLFVEI